MLPPLALTRACTSRANGWDRKEMSIECVGSQRPTAVARAIQMGPTYVVVLTFDEAVVCSCYTKGGDAQPANGSLYCVGPYLAGGDS